jgi:hypothetical protein
VDGSGLTIDSTRSGCAVVRFDICRWGPLFAARAVLRVLCHDINWIRHTRFNITLNTFRFDSKSATPEFFRTGVNSTLAELHTQLINRLNLGQIEVLLKRGILGAVFEDEIQLKLYVLISHDVVVAVPK